MLNEFKQKINNKNIVNLLLEILFMKIKLSILKTESDFIFDYLLINGWTEWLFCPVYFYATVQADCLK